MEALYLEDDNRKRNVVYLCYEFGCGTHFHNNSYYIGSSNNIKKRLIAHNKGRSKYTRNKVPYELVYKKEFNSRSEAYKYEMKLKSLKKRKSLENIINNQGT